jgi:hypothetical protein
MHTKEGAKTLCSCSALLFSKPLSLRTNLTRFRSLVSEINQKRAIGLSQLGQRQPSNGASVHECVVPTGTVSRTPASSTSSSCSSDPFEHFHPTSCFSVGAAPEQSNHGVAEHVVPAGTRTPGGGTFRKGRGCPNWDRRNEENTVAASHREPVHSKAWHYTAHAAVQQAPKTAVPTGTAKALPVTSSSLVIPAGTIIRLPDLPDPRTVAVCCFGNGYRLLDSNRRSMIRGVREACIDRYGWCMATLMNSRTGKINITQNQILKIRETSFVEHFVSRRPGVSQSNLISA